MPRITVEFTPVPGDWGAQIFRRGPGAFTYGSPLVPGDLPAARYSALVFDTDQHRERFLAALDEAQFFWEEEGEE
jgi:hypothetical protein